MIAQLTGTLAHKSPEGLIVDVNGVGYEVFVSRTTLDRVPETGARLTLLIYTHVTEGAVSLYGFSTLREKNLFKKLITVSGIGPRLATQILSGLSSQDLVQALMGGDLIRLTGISGVGKKTAERMVVELKDKMLDFVDHTLIVEETYPKASFTGKDQTYHEALSALVNLGYTKPLAERALSQLKIRPESTFEEVLKGSLGILSR